VLDRLVAVCVVTHVHHCHLTDFVNRETVIAVVEYRRYREYRIHHCHKHVITAHQVNQSLRIVEYRP